MKIMIDAGHGGTAPGAVNKTVGIQEKDINLAVALQMRIVALSQIEPRNLSLRLTRIEDESLSLQKRCDIANAFEADIFVSLHCNARPMKGKYGIELETYYLSTSGLAYAKAVQSRLLADVGREVTVFDRGTKKFGYYVLRHTAMPAILVEMGFLSDDEEARWLNNVPHQKLLASSILKGVLTTP